MDMLRSCSRQAIRPVPSTPVFQPVATWFFAKEGALPFPAPHSFGSPVWDEFHPMPTSVGFNALAARAYYNGRRLNSSEGRSFAGPVEWFRTGAPVAGNLPRALNGTPLVCLKRPLGLMTGGQTLPRPTSAGGLITGGTTYAMSPSCTLCPGGTPTTVLIGSSGFTVPSMNGVFFLPQTASPCVWQYDVGPGEYVRAYRLVDRWAIQFISGIDVAQYEDSNPDVCLGITSVDQVASTMGGGSPFSIEGLP